MSVRGRWRLVETPGYDMAVTGAYILFDEVGGEFAFDCLTGFHGSCDGDAAQFSWEGNDEMEPASGDGWAELQDDGSLELKSASSTATTSHSSHVVQRLLQQPVRVRGRHAVREDFAWRFTRSFETVSMISPDSAGSGTTRERITEPIISASDVIAALRFAFALCPGTSLVRSPI